MPLTTRVVAPHRSSTCRCPSNATGPEGPLASSARRRILDTANALFYAYGLRAVGIDRIIADAGVAKATFYHHVPTKDELVRAYIEEQSEFQQAVVAQLSNLPPRQALMKLFDVIGDMTAGPAFRGCHFINAAAEYPDPNHRVREAISAHRRWFRGLLRDLLIADGRVSADAEAAADILVVLRDGLVVGGDLDDPNRLGIIIRNAVTRVIETSGTS